MKTTAATIMLILTLASSVAMAEGCNCKASTGPVVRALNDGVFIWPNSPGTEQAFNFVLDLAQLERFIRELNDARVRVQRGK